MLGDDDTTIRITIKMAPTLKILERKREDICNNGVTILISNFQKNHGQIFTSRQTICELDSEVISTYMCNICNYIVSMLCVCCSEFQYCWFVENTCGEQSSVGTWCLCWCDWCWINRVPSQKHSVQLHGCLTIGLCHVLWLHMMSTTKHTGQDCVLIIICCYRLTSS